MTTDVLASVVVPCYNAAPYLPTLIRTLQHNTGDGIEFVLVDDASTDDTPGMLDRLHADVAGARVVHRDHNGGLGAARNTGTDAAAGRYLCFLDADDWLAPGHISRLVEAMEEYQVDFIRTDHVTVHGRQRTIVRSPESRRNRRLDPRDSILPLDRSSGVDYPYAWAGMFDLDAMGKDLLHFDEQLHTCEDRPWLWRIARTAKSHAVIGLTGNFYRRGVTDSLTELSDARQLHFLDAFEIIVSETATDDDADLLLPKAVRSYCAIMSHHLSRRSRFDQSLRRELLRRCRDALHRLPQPMLDDVLDSMGGSRVRQLRRLRRWGMT